jgi:hypothetical protein
MNDIYAGKSFNVAKRSANPWQLKASADMMREK